MPTYVYIYYIFIYVFFEDDILHFYDFLILIVRERWEKGGGRLFIVDNRKSSDLV
jgi:hypothetical protein